MSRKKKVGRSKKAQRKLTKGQEPQVTTVTTEVEAVEHWGTEGWGQYRLVSSQGHYLVLLAKGQEVALNRWNEFYPNVDKSTVTVTRL